MKLQHKTLLAVGAIALVVRLLALAVYLPQMNPNVDLDSYRSLAQNLATGNGFVAASMDGRVLPNVSRTPVYPVFLATLIRLGGDRLGLFLLAQCILGAATCMLTYILASRWVSDRYAMVASILLALDPNSIVRCVDLRTETLFTLLLVSGACLLAWRDRNWQGWTLAGFVWSLAALCRPIAVWLWLVVLAVILLRRQRLALFLAFLAGYLPLECVWAARNHGLTGRAFISTISTYNLLIYRGAGVEAEQPGKSLEVVQRQLLERFGDIELFDNRELFESRLRDYRVEGSRQLFANPVTAIKQVIVGWGKILFGPGAHSIDNMLRDPRKTSRWRDPVYAVGLIAVAALGLIGTIKLSRDAVLLAAIALYFILLAGGPESNSRFRVPITPILAVLATAGICGPKEKE